MSESNVFNEGWPFDGFFGMSDEFQEDMDMLENEHKQQEKAVSIYRSAVEVHNEEIIDDMYMILSSALDDRQKLLQDLGIEVTHAFIKETDHEFRTLFRLALNKCMGGN